LHHMVVGVGERCVLDAGEAPCPKSGLKDGAEAASGDTTT